MRCRLRMIVVGLVAFALVSCSGEGETSLPPTLPSHASCAPKLADADGVKFPEVAAQAGSQVSLYGLLFASYPVQARRETKIAWRVGGRGPITFRAVSPTGRVVQPLWGPEAHGESNWLRPGDEWGTGFRFSTAGCWTVRVDRGGEPAAVGLLVVH